MNSPLVTRKIQIGWFTLLFLVSLVVLPYIFAENKDQKETPQGTKMTASHLWSELFQQSQKEKKGLTFFIKGQTVAGIVTTVIGDEVIEVRNQTFGRIVIRLESVDAIAIN